MLKVVILFTIIIAIASHDPKCDVQIDKLDSSQSPSAIGPYSKATRINFGENDMIIFSGQIGINPKTGELISDNVTDQAVQALENVKNILEENFCSLENVAKTTVFIADMNDFTTINGIYSKYFVGKTLPARSVVAVKTLPKNAKFEIEGYAFSKSDCRKPHFNIQ